MPLPSANKNSRRVSLRQDVLRLKQELKRNGVSDKIYHSKILQESEAVKGVHAELEPLRAAVKSFHGLPADLALAKQQVACLGPRLPWPVSGASDGRLAGC